MKINKWIVIFTLLLIFFTVVSPSFADNGNETTGNPKLDNLTISVDVNNTNPTQGEYIQYIVKIINTGDTDISSVVVNTQLNSSLEFVKSNYPLSNSKNSLYNWNLVDLTANDVFTLKVCALIKNSGPTDNLFSLSINGENGVKNSNIVYIDSNKEPYNENDVIDIIKPQGEVKINQTQSTNDSTNINDSHNDKSENDNYNNDNYNNYKSQNAKMEKTGASLTAILFGSILLISLLFISFLRVEKKRLN